MESREDIAEEFERLGSEFRSINAGTSEIAARLMMRVAAKAMKTVRRAVLLGFYQAADNYPWPQSPRDALDDTTSWWAGCWFSLCLSLGETHHNDCPTSAFRRRIDDRGKLEYVAPTPEDWPETAMNYADICQWLAKRLRMAGNLLLTAIDDRRRRRDGDRSSPQPDAGDESTSPVLEGDSVDGSFLGIEIDEANRTISRRGFDHRVDLSSRNVLWKLFQALYRAHGETMSSKDESSLKGEKSGLRKAVVDLKEYLQAVELTVSHFPYRLTEDVTPK